MSSCAEYALERFEMLDAKEERYEDFEDDSEDEDLASSIFLSDDVRKLINSNSKLTEEDKILIQRLATKSFHFPNHSYCQDWWMFYSNNHIILSFFLAHPLHPFGLKERILNLVASLSFGLSATSFVALWYFHHSDQEKITYISVFGFFNVTQGLVVTAFFGGFCNVLFDFFIWFIQVCPLCQPGSIIFDKLSDSTRTFWLWMGSNVAFIVTAIAISLAINLIAVRASVIDDGNEDGYAHSIQCYSFIGTFLLEVLITQALMFPIVAFTIFSGVLGCFVLPGVGGRPYQKRKADRRLTKKRRSERVLVEV